MAQDHHYSDHLSHYVSLRPEIEPGLTACQASMLPLAQILNNILILHVFYTY